MQKTTTTTFKKLHVGDYRLTTRRVAIISATGTLTGVDCYTS